MYFPSQDEFLELGRRFDFVPVFRRLLSDALTPVTAFLHLAQDASDAFLFESVVGGEKIGRYSFLSARPYQVLSAYGRQVQLTTAGREEQRWEAVNPLKELARLVGQVRVAQVPGLPPFSAGVVGYAAYDAVRYLERLPHPPQDDRHLPDLYFAFYDSMVVFDQVDKTLLVVVLAPTAECESSGQLESAYQQAQRRIDALVEHLARPSPVVSLADIHTAGEPQIPYRSNFTREEFEAAVRKCLEYIRAGDIFQVVISQRLETELRAPAFEVYRTLRVVNPSPFMFYLRSPQVTLVGSSPEIMVRVVDRRVTVRPLAGTRPRGRTEEEDRRLAEELLADPKERAEHVMLVDLGRNDVGRVCRFGSVQLEDVMTIERYSHVMHITSSVHGELLPEKDAFDALAACLPAGTVSGAPKVRAMEIIDELEPHRRGPYAGAVGYVDFHGNMDTCIALRTLVIQGQRAYIQAGAGIVADSVPQREYQETLNKAKGLLKAIELTHQRMHAAACASASAQQGPK